MTGYKHLRSAIMLILSVIIISGSSMKTVKAEAGTEHLYAVHQFSRTKLRVLDWVTSQGVKPTAEQAELLAKIWTETGEVTGEDLLNRVIATFAMYNTDVAQFVSQCKMVDGPLEAPEIPETDNSASNEFFRSNLAAYAGKYFTYRRMYDEALKAYENVDLLEAVDPGTVLFNQAVCQQALLKVEDALQSLHNLQNRTSNVPNRHLEIAKLMEHELSALKPQSLDEIAMQMQDVERRLDLGRSGHKTQKIEDQIITSMDEIIAKMEKQMQQGKGNGPGNSNQPETPAEDSQVKGNTAPGNVDKKDIGHKDGWGNLPPQDQAKAKQVVGDLFPSNYEKIIEKFGEKSASRKNP